MAYGDRELSSGMSGDDVQDLQVKLSGWFGTYPANKPRWDGTFDSTTEDAVMRFQVAHNIPDTGVVDHWTFAAIDNEADDHFFSLERYKCPARRGGCKGYGSNKSTFLHKKDDGTKYSILIPGGEKPGVSKVLVWLVRGLMHRANCTYYNVSGGGYRCAYYNEDKNYTTTNHIGQALDIKPFRSDWSEAKKLVTVTVGGNQKSLVYTDAVYNFRDICEEAGIPDDVRESGTIYMERNVPLTFNGYYASSWVHLDVRTALDDIGGHPSDWYGTSYEEVDAPFYAGQLLSIASAAPPSAPDVPPPYDVDEVVASVDPSASGIEAWSNFVVEEQGRIDASTDALAGTADPVAVPQPSDIEGVVNAGVAGGTNGLLNLAYSQADIMEAARRSYLMSRHTRDDYRTFGRINNAKLKSALSINNAMFLRRFENFSAPIEDCHV